MTEEKIELEGEGIAKCNDEEQLHFTEIMLNFLRKSWDKRRAWAKWFGVLGILWAFIFIGGGFIYSIHKGQTDFYTANSTLFFWIFVILESPLGLWFSGSILENIIVLLKVFPKFLSGKGVSSLVKESIKIMRDRKSD